MTTTYMLVGNHARGITAKRGGHAGLEASPLGGSEGRGVECGGDVGLSSPRAPPGQDFLPRFCSHSPPLAFFLR